MWRSVVRASGTVLLGRSGGECENDVEVFADDPPVPCPDCFAIGAKGFRGCGWGFGVGDGGAQTSTSRRPRRCCCTFFNAARPRLCVRATSVEFPPASPLSLHETRPDTKLNTALILATPGDCLSLSTSEPCRSVSGVNMRVSLYPASRRRSSRRSYVPDLPRLWRGTRPGLPFARLDG